MKEIFFVMSLLLPTEQLPSVRLPMPSLEACLAKVAERAEAMAADTPEMNTTYQFGAGCMVVSTKANPA